MEFSNGKYKICKILAKNKFDKYNLHMSPSGIFKRKQLWYMLNNLAIKVFKNITLWLCHLKISILACDNIGTVNIYIYIYIYIFIFHVWKTNYLIFFWLLNINISLGQCHPKIFSWKKSMMCLKLLWHLNFQKKSHYATAALKFCY